MAAVEARQFAFSKSGPEKPCDACLHRSGPVQSRCLPFDSLQSTDLSEIFLKEKRAALDALLVTVQNPGLSWGNR